MYPRRQEYDPRPPPSRLLTYQEPNQGERSRFYVAPSEAEDDSSESGYSGEGGDQTDEPVETQLGEGMEHDYDAGMLLDEDEPDFRGCHVLFIGPYPDEELLDKLKHRVQVSRITDPCWTALPADLDGLLIQAAVWRRSRPPKATSFRDTLGGISARSLATHGSSHFGSGQRLCSWLPREHPPRYRAGCQWRPERIPRLGRVPYVA